MKTIDISQSDRNTLQKYLLLLHLLHIFSHFCWNRRSAVILHRFFSADCESFLSEVANRFPTVEALPMILTAVD